MSTTETDGNTQRPGDAQLDQPNMSIAADAVFDMILVCTRIMSTFASLRRGVTDIGCYTYQYAIPLNFIR